MTTSPRVCACVRAITLPLLMGLAFAAGAAPQSKDEQRVLGQLKKLYPATQFSKVSKTPLKGVYEVVMGPNVAYVDATGRHFLFGHLFDMQTQTDLTARQLVGGGAPAVTYETAPPAPGTPIDLAQLPLGDALKRVNGTGERMLVVFSDPLCPYCKRLDADLPELANTTVYTFLTPILGPNSRKAAETLWAESAPGRDKELAAIDRNLALASRLGVNGTPTLIRADGQRTAGAMPPSDLAQWLDASAKPALRAAQ